MTSTLTYKDKPLQRKGNKIYYGDPKEKYLLLLNIKETKDLEDIKISTSVGVELQDNSGRTLKTIRKAERDGIFEALDLGEYWLNEALEIG